MNDLGFLFAGFATIWILLGLYIFTLGRRQSGLRQEVERLERGMGPER
jgi:CcmD family protein